MLHFCSVDDVKGLTQSAPRFNSTFETVRDAVTARINAYLRRDLGYEDNVIQYFDAIQVGRGVPFYLYLDKKAIEGGVIIESAGRAITGAVLDAKDGKLTITGPMRYAPRGIKVVYSGGYKPSEADETVMLCPAELKLAAIQQCQFELSELLNNDAGHTESDRGRNTLTKEKTIEGLSFKVARAFGPYRKSLARVV